MSAIPLQKSNKLLTTILLEAGVVTREQINEGLSRQQETGQRIGETLVEMGVVSEEDIGWALSRQLRLTFVDLQLDALNEDLVQEFPETMLRRVQAVPLVRSDNELLVAMADPTDPMALEELERSAGVSLGVGVATPTMIRVALDHIHGARHEDSPIPRSQVQLVKHDQDLAWEPSGSAFLQFHLTDALKWRATEIHFVPDQEELKVFYRIGPDLNCVATESLRVVEFLLSRLQTLGVPSLAEPQVSLEAQTSCTFGKSDISFGVSLARCRYGVTVVAQLHATSEKSPSLPQLGLTAEQIERVHAVLQEPAGIILVSGPARSGGTTTLCSFLECMDTNARRLLYFSSKPLPTGAEAVRVPVPENPEKLNWCAIVNQQSADIVVLDDLLLGHDIRAILETAVSGKLLLVRTDWAETSDILDYLLNQPRARLTLSKRLLAVVQQRIVRFSESDPELESNSLPDWQRGVFEVTTFDEESRRAILEGEGTARVLARATKNGLPSIADRCRVLVEKGLLGGKEAARVQR